MLVLFSENLCVDVSTKVLPRLIELKVVRLYITRAKDLQG